MKRLNIKFRNIAVNNLNIFFREAGDPQNPALLLLHGFPTSSHMFRDLIPLLADDFHLIAPDLPGFGGSDTPDHKSFAYTFDHLAEIIGDFVEQLGLKKFAIYIFDYGAPVGLRVALRFPDRIAAIITQNGNAYIEGFSDAWTPWQRYWRDPSPENQEACRASFLPETIREGQYFHGVERERISPDGYTLDIAYMNRPGAEERQLDLILDYRSNVAMYPAFQKFFRDHQPPTLAVWGKNDPHFLPAGAEAYRRDNPGARIVFSDTGHFALETHAFEIAQEMRLFLKQL